MNELTGSQRIKIKSKITNQRSHQNGHAPLAPILIFQTSVPYEKIRT